MNIINDYYPELPIDATWDERIKRQMLQMIENIENCDRIFDQLKMFDESFSQPSGDDIRAKLRANIIELDSRNTK